MPDILHDVSANFIMPIVVLVILVILIKASVKILR
jgi:hypothetical protein